MVLKELGLTFKLIYCIGDPEGDGWKVGEVNVADQPSPFSSFGGVSNLAEAERQYKNLQSKTAKGSLSVVPPAGNGAGAAAEDDDDDDYWARYDATPARTPGAQTSPAPGANQNEASKTAEEDYYAQYDMVQPAMDNHDPDEEANLPADLISPPLGLMKRSDLSRSKLEANGHSAEEAELNETRGAWTLAEGPKAREETDANLLHPRPASSASSNASVEKLEAAAETFGVQQHISRSIKSLYMLSRASGMDRDEFERIVKTELDMLGLMDEV